MKTLFIFTALMLINIITYSQTVKRSDWANWKNKERSISINHPNDWIFYNFDKGEIVGFITPKDNENDHFPDNLVLSSLPNSENKSLDEFKTNLLSGFNNLTIKSFQKLKLAKTEYLRIVLESEDGKTSVISFIFIKFDKVYFLTLSIEKRNWKRFSWIGDEAFKSLIIK